MSESSIPPGGGLRLPTEPTLAAPAPGAGVAAGSGAGVPSPAGASQPTFPETMLPSRTELPRGASIGRYLVIERLGAGGMGVVYAAYDPELDRRVAIKLLHGDGLEFGSSFGRTRLMREAQAMARLAHPNVVAVYDIGTFGDRVFIAMEHIEGGTLTAWLNKEPRSRRDILKMFIAAGHGLAAAHAAGLVHRDFKPDNVLIGQDGRARVTDFGIARSVDGARDLGHGELRPGRVTEKREDGPVSGLTETSQSLNAPLTQEGALLGTPRYMSPEQFRGARTDPRTDQFSFCVALFEALYGLAPFPGEQLASRCMNVMQGHMQTLPLDVQRTVPAWLRTILLRGLSRDPEDRYPTMDALLAALSRDVDAIRRRWAMTLLAGLLAVGVGALAHRMNHRPPTSLCRGNGERLIGVWDPGRKQAVKSALLSTGRGYAQETWERLEQTLDGYTHDWLKGQVEACEATFVRGVQSQTALDLRVRCLNRRLEEVSALTDQLTAKLNQDAGAALERAGGVAYELTPLAVCADVAALSAPVPLPDSPQQRQRVDELGGSLAALRAAERIGLYSSLLPRARAVVEDARQLGYAPLLAEAQILLGDLQIQSADRPGAEQTLFQAVAAAVSGRDHRRAGEAWTMLMFVAAERREYEPAGRWEMLARAELELTSSVDDIKGQLHNNLCIAAIRKRKYEDALKSCDQALEYRIKFFGPSHPLVAAVYANKALAYRHLDQLQQSLDLSRRAYDIDASALGPHHPRLALTLANIGNIFRTQEKFAEAEEVFRREADIYKTALGEDNPRYTEALYSLALTYQAQERWSEAQGMAEKALAIRRKALGPDHADVAGALSLLARGYQRQQLFAEALPLHQEALAIHEKHHNDDMIAALLVAVAKDLRGLKRWPEALPLLDRAEALRSKTGGSRDRDLLTDIDFVRARILLEQNPKRNRAQAIELSQRARQSYVQQGLRARHDLAELDAWRAENKLP